MANPKRMTSARGYEPNYASPPGPNPWIKCNHCGTLQAGLMYGPTPKISLRLLNSSIQTHWQTPMYCQRCGYKIMDIQGGIHDERI